MECISLHDKKYEASCYKYEIVSNLSLNDYLWSPYTINFTRWMLTAYVKEQTTSYM